MYEEIEEMLKPCPFCGGKAYIEEIPPHKHYFIKGIPDCAGESFAGCTKCSCMIAADTTAEVIAMWNRRI